MAKRPKTIDALADPEAAPLPDIQAVDVMTTSETQQGAPTLIAVPATASLVQQVIADVKSETPITQACLKQPDGSCPLSDCPCGNNV
ncbi:hypothetical protein [Salinivibrio sp. ML290]|nr:hypothetical protein BZG23_08315 [Salinivibrio sp. ML290]